MANKIDSTVGNLAGLWTVTEIAFAELPPETAVTLHFADGKLSGMAPCNAYEATIDVEGDKFHLGPMERDDEDCETELLEAEVNFMRVLERSNRFEIEADGTLTLFALDVMMLKARR